VGDQSKSMLTALTTGLRFRLAILLTAFATLCFVAPPAVLAFGHGSATADCMAHADVVGHGKTGTSQHSQHHGDHSAPTGNHQPSCCGLFCMSALVADVGVGEPDAIPSTPYPPREHILFSRVTERLDRPPISLRIV
jgi:hypothetical protein